MLSKKMYLMNLLQKVNTIQTNDNNNLGKKITKTQKLNKLKIKFLIAINILLLNNLIS